MQANNGLQQTQFSYFIWLKYLQLALIDVFIWIHLSNNLEYLFQMF